MTDTLCVVPHARDPERPRLALDGLRVCAGHEARLSRWLRQLAPLHAAMDSAVAQGDRSGGPVVSGTRDVGVDLSDRVTAVRAAIRHKLASWVLLVAEEAKATPPDLSAEGRPAPLVTVRRRSYNVIDPRDGTVTMVVKLSQTVREVTDVQVLADWLTTWHEWLLAQEYVDDWAQDLYDLHSEAWSCAYPSGRKWHVIADCPVDGCGGQLRANVAAGDDLLPDRVICTEEPEHTWEAGEWRALRRSLPGRPEWLTVAALSQLHGVPARTLYRWAHEDGWASVCPVPSSPWLSAARHPALYHVDVVEAAVAARRAMLDSA